MKKDKSSNEQIVGKMTPDDFFDLLDRIEQAKFNLDYTHSFKKSVKSCYKSNSDLNLLLVAVTFLVQNGCLEDIYFPHSLKGFPKKKNKKVMECHISPDWLLVWIQDDTDYCYCLKHAPIPNCSILKN
ncbi:MAG: type II toxin-antitoxin system YafQ family toxin [Dysgonamonadaceae bacterium]|jgi:addiction module RelE/StbE family toxin|nr:type II toxin-antitoxin system YafQ family toxin [Dysgonamonadaceae bacterium]